MIVGIGTDIAEIIRFERAYLRWGERFASRILHDDDMRSFPAAANKFRFLAMRFAAKEATAKALGTGFKQGVAPRQIGVVHERSGKPNLVVNGRAAELFAEKCVVVGHVSLSDDGGFAVAMVVLETQ